MAFLKGENPNHPKKGTRIKVEPIKKLNDIRKIKKRLKNNPRDFCLFILGINSAFRASDLLKIKVRDVKHLNPAGELELKEKKTGKNRRVTLNNACIDAIQTLLNSNDFQDEDFVFTGQRGRLTVPTVNRMVKHWCRYELIPGNFGSHTLRKTWGYHQRTTFNTALPILMEAFGHSTQKQTMTYLCIQPEEIKSIYLNEL